MWMWRTWENVLIFKNGIDDKGFWFFKVFSENNCNLSDMKLIEVDKLEDGSKVPTIELKVIERVDRETFKVLTIDCIS